MAARRFSAFPLGDMALANRMVMAPMTRNCADDCFFLLSGRI